MTAKTQKQSCQRWQTIWKSSACKIWHRARVARPLASTTGQRFRGASVALWPSLLSHPRCFHRSTFLRRQSRHVYLLVTINLNNKTLSYSIRTQTAVVSSAMVRELVWLENETFAAWGCRGCTWIVSGGGPIPVRAPATIQQAFDQHQCVDFPHQLPLRRREA